MNTNTNHEISLQVAIEMTTRYRANKPNNFPICETFSKAAIEKLLATTGCVSLRIYYGMKENLEADAVIVAANAEGEDILPPIVTTTLQGADPLILEDGLRCPQDCPPASPLNP